LISKTTGFFSPFKKAFPDSSKSFFEPVIHPSVHEPVESGVSHGRPVAANKDVLNVGNDKRVWLYHFHIDLEHI
jgi:hypothetical protein